MDTKLGGGGARINAHPLGFGETTKQKKMAPKWMSSKLCILIFYTEFEFSHWGVPRGELSCDLCLSLFFMFHLVLTLKDTKKLDDSICKFVMQNDHGWHIVEFTYLAPGE